MTSAPLIFASVFPPSAGRPGAKCFGPFPLPLRSSGKIARFGLFTLAFDLSQESGRKLSDRLQTSIPSVASRKGARNGPSNHPDSTDKSAKRD